MGEGFDMGNRSTWPGIARFRENTTVSGYSTYGRIVTNRSLAVIGLLGVLAAGCGGGAKTVVKPVAQPSALPSSAAASPSKAALPSPSSATTDPLTGLALRHSPIVVIKVDNATTARRYQKGLGQAA